MNGENLQLMNGFRSRRRLSALLAFLFLICNTMNALAFQGNALVTFKASNISIAKVFAEVKKQTGLIAFYNNKMLNDQEKISVDFNRDEIEEVMKSVLKGKNLQFEVNDKYILIKSLKEANSSLDANELSQVKANIDITGKVFDEKGAPLPGVNVVVMGSNLATQTDGNGQFTLKNVKENAVLNFSFLGYRTLQLTAKAKMTIKLEPSQLKINEVIVTGTGINRDTRTFTGATATFTGEELKTVGNNNIIQSLKALDPSFIVIDNNLKGSNPNVMPEIEIRGKTGATGLSLKDEFGSDPNLPLFILDGFEAPINVIIDLDMNRVASVVILKDAASTALYGAKAANGVVVVETVKPKAGQLQFSYTNDFQVQASDLTVYNLMNAAEKLEFERQSGLYTFMGTADPDRQYGLDTLYNSRLARVKRGVDTYWLNEPVRTGLTHNTSISATGGDQSFRYGVGINYKQQPGVMKGSNRDSWGGNINLNYRKSKVNINNSTYVRGYSSNESPYGDFSDFANANPYFMKTGERYLDVSRMSTGLLGDLTEVKVANPLYNANVAQKDNSKNLDLTNNLSIRYDILPSLQIQGGLQLSKQTTTTEIFQGAEHTDFDQVASELKGKYTNRKVDNYSYTGNLLVTFGKMFANKHSITANARGEIREASRGSMSFLAVGFPAESNGNPRFANSYPTTGAPSAFQSVYRTINATVSANYAYDSRYLLDASYRLDGSTSFGASNPYSPYWSTGLGWNASNEAFLKDASWIKRLKVYGNIGVTGNQNFGSVNSTTIYQYSANEYNKFGQGLNMSQLGNPYLKAQTTMQISTGVEFTLTDRLSGYFKAYEKYTDDLVVSIEPPSSRGVTSYQQNIGNLSTRGIEAMVSYSPIYDRSKRIMWTISVTGASHNSKYGGFGNALANLNRDQQTNKSLIRYEDGYSPEAIWAAQSLGIDPSTGREMFLTANGDYTYDYNDAAIKAVGNTNPAVEGMINNRVTIKSFSLGLGIRYIANADIFNTAIYNKVENITYDELKFNQDKRAFYERWKKPGDVTQFKGISLTSTTPMSSRFVQTENTLSLESVNMGYTFEGMDWIKAVGLKRLEFMAYANDIFRFSTVKRERGIEYPFARSVSFTLKAQF